MKITIVPYPLNDGEEEFSVNSVSEAIANIKEKSIRAHLEVNGTVIARVDAKTTPVKIYFHEAQYTNGLQLDFPVEITCKPTVSGSGIQEAFSGVKIKGKAVLNLKQEIR